MEVVVLMDEVVLLSDVSPLPTKNHFHPLPDRDGEEDIKRIVVVVRPPIISLPLAPT